MKGYWITCVRRVLKLSCLDGNIQLQIMAHGLSKEELDEQFEEFLKESLSDDSLGNSKKKSSILETLGQPRKRETKKKDSVPWWISEEDSDDGEFQARFVKVKKEKKILESHAEIVENSEQKNPHSNSEAVAPPKPSSSASRSKALSKFKMLEKFHKNKKESYFNEEEGSLASDSPDNSEGNKFTVCYMMLKSENGLILKVLPRQTRTKEGMLGAKEKFVKIQNASQSMGEGYENMHVEKLQLQESNGVAASLSKDSLETNDSVLASGPNEGIVGVGLDTLEEQEEKEIFFAKLEQEASSTIDYSRLNKEMDSNDSVVLAPFVRNEKNEKGEEEPAHEEKSGSYSEDFEEEADANTAFKTEESQVDQNIVSGVALSPQEQEEASAGMLAKVVLLDSQDSTTELQKAIETSDVALGEHYLCEEVSGTEINEAGASYGQTTSDIEALHQAYHHIDQSLQDTDEQKLQDSPVAVSECLVQGVSQNNDIYSKNMSTIESDLPTVEELMKPIKGHACNIGSFAAEPESAVKLIGSTANDLVSHLPFEEQQNNTVWDTNSFDKFNRKESIFLRIAVSDDNFQRVTEKEIQTSEIEPNVLEEKIVQESPLLQQESKTEQALQSSLKNEKLESMATKTMVYKNIRSPAPLHKKKSSYGPHGVARSSGYGKSTSLSKQSFPADEKKTPKENFKKTGVKAKSPADRLRSKAFFATRIIKSAANEPTTKRSINRVRSGQSVVNNLGHQAVDYCRQYQHDLSFSPIKSCDRELYLLKRVQDTEEDLNKARDLIQQLTSTVSQKEKEIETKLVELKTQHEKELSRLGQENYILQSKLRSMEELTKEKSWTHHTATVPVTEEKLAQIKKEIEDQEVIIQGYQQENERLYKKMKELQIENKKNEERMFKENQCLMSELIALREKIEKTNIQSQILRDSEGARSQSFTELISELCAARKEEAKLQEEIRRLKQDKQALEVDLGQAKKERDLAKVQIASTSGEKSYEFKVMEESYKQEITNLKRRLQWYAENQDLLDKDAARLKDARGEIEKLKLEVEKLRAEAGDQSAQQKKRLRDRAADAKRIQDLERQIKEMEGILKRRYPNSLPALIYAAAATEKTNDISAKANTVDFLEKRIKKLETELEGKDDEAKKSLRAMEQQFQKIKIQYEQRLVELEQLLAYKFMSEPSKLNGDKAYSTELEQELQNLKTTHQITVKNLQTEIENLKSQNFQLKLRSKKDNKDLESTDSQMKQGNTKDRLLKLNEELVIKNKEIQDLTKTVEKLQKERMVMLSDDNLRNKTDNKENSTETLRKNTSAADKRNSSKREPFLSIFSDDKIYQPQTFSDSNLSEVLQENAQLKEELERLSLEMNQQRVKSQAKLAYSENNIRRIQEDTAEYIASLKASHQREVEKILCQHAREHSTSKVAELNSRISTQEILIKHLQEQISEQQRHQEALLVSQMREELLQKEVTKLLEELREAKENQSPEMKHFLCLEKKIKHMETRHAEREQEIRKAAQLTQHVTEARQTHEVEKWRRLAHRKNQELEKFRVELDSILDVLRELQKQGVVIPAPDSSGFSMTDSCWKT
ncbi:centrosomal protein of 162 kDa isoform X3 [Cuculus canorus]|uniref:centrosomal protein of 162 kDa isoform X3 n=1 Tax=Cuculus canorus TaxID=55661 RepID=UPI0023AA5C84|nr:centrosomal protein of 162 kDa isoform X3 [Cuculus canorus]